MPVDLTALPQPGAFDNLEDWAAEFVGAMQSAFLRNPFTLVPPVAVAALPPATQAGLMAYVVDEAGGATLAFSNGTSWLRVLDLAVVS